MQSLTIKGLLESASLFCEQESGKGYEELFGVTDGKAVGTFVEHKFKEYLKSRFSVEVGNTASGIDLPSINTDIKVTSFKQPQSSCPFKDSKQKIYGLGYHLIVFVYSKHDDAKGRVGILDFLSCSFIDKGLTGDYQTTTGLRAILDNDGNDDDVFAFLNDHHIPADEPTLMQMAHDIMQNPPKVGYLTISNALQWRLQYGRIVKLTTEVDGIVRIVNKVKQ